MTAILLLIKSPVASAVFQIEAVFIATAAEYFALSRRLRLYLLLKFLAKEKNP